MRAKLLILMVFSLVLARSAGALEIIAPQPDTVLGEGKVIVIGLAPKAEKGKADFGGQSTSFKVKDGSFVVALNLPAGQQEVAFTVGSETAKIKWKIDPGSKKAGYRYHPGIENEKCTSCHAEGVKLDREEPVAATCGRCHKPMDKTPVVHGPVAMGLCAACHDPHGSKEGKALRSAVLALCQDCHNQPVTETHRKNAGDSVCTKCHDPHGSAKPYMIK